MPQIKILHRDTETQYTFTNNKMVETVTIKRALWRYIGVTK